MPRPKRPACGWWRKRRSFPPARPGGILNGPPGRRCFMTKEDVAAALIEYGQLLELKGEPSFRTLSYHTAARAILEYPGDFPTLVAAGRVTEIQGIGST